MDQIKKPASYSLQDKYKSARIALTDVTEAEVLTEEATNGDLCSPDAKTMTRIAEASYGIDDYWRIVGVLHRRLYCVDWKKWRQSYKTLVVLEFLLTHGPEDFAEEFACDIDVIEELGTFRYVDDNEFNWGASMLTKSKEILKLLGGGKNVLREARFRALRVLKEIQGFGSSLFVYPLSTSSSSFESSLNSSLGSFSTNDTCDETRNTPHLLRTKVARMEKFSLVHEIKNDDDNDDISHMRCENKNIERLHIWGCPSIQENGSFIEGKDVQEQEEVDYSDSSDNESYYGKSRDGFVGGIFSKLASLTTPSRGNNKGFRSISDVGKVTKKRFNRQFSLW